MLVSVAVATDTRAVGQAAAIVAGDRLSSVLGAGEFSARLQAASAATPASAAAARLEGALTRCQIDQRWRVGRLRRPDDRAVHPVGHGMGWHD